MHTNKIVTCIECEIEYQVNENGVMMTACECEDEPIVTFLSRDERRAVLVEQAKNGNEAAAISLMWM